MAGITAAQHLISARTLWPVAITVPDSAVWQTAWALAAAALDALDGVTAAASSPRIVLASQTLEIIGARLQGADGILQIVNPNVPTASRDAQAIDLATARSEGEGWDGEACLEWYRDLLIRRKTGEGAVAANLLLQLVPVA